MRRPHYQIVADQLSHDTIQCLERLLDEARRGQVIGIAFAALMRRRHFVTHACGEVRRERVYARGMLRELDDELAKTGD